MGAGKMHVKQAFHKGLQNSLMVLLAIGSLHLSAAENHYRWLNEHGNPVHSDRPPPAGIDYEVISTKSGLKRVVSGEQEPVPREIEPRVDKEFEQVPREPQADAGKNPETCNIARKNLETLNTFARVRVRDDQGDIQYLSDEEKAAQRNEAEALIRQHCD